MSVTSDVTKSAALPLLERLGANAQSPEERWVERYSIADLVGQELRAQLAQPELPKELAMSIRQVSRAAHEAASLLLRRLEAYGSRTPRQCQDLGTPANWSHLVDDSGRVVGGRGWRIAGSADDEHRAQQLVVDP